MIVSSALVCWTEKELVKRYDFPNILFWCCRQSASPSTVALCSLPIHIQHLHTLNDRRFSRMADEGLNLMVPLLGRANTSQESTARRGKSTFEKATSFPKPSKQEGRVFVFDVKCTPVLFIKMVCIKTKPLHISVFPIHASLKECKVKHWWNSRKWSSVWVQSCPIRVCKWKLALAFTINRCSYVNHTEQGSALRSR